MAASKLCESASVLNAEEKVLAFTRCFQIDPQTKLQFNVKSPDLHQHITWLPWGIKSGSSHHPTSDLQTIRGVEPAMVKESRRQGRTCEVESQTSPPKTSPHLQTGENLRGLKDGVADITPHHVLLPGSARLQTSHHIMSYYLAPPDRAEPARSQRW